jgi:hypothetical protein
MGPAWASGMHKKGVVVNDEIPDTGRLVPVENFFDDGLRMAFPAAGLQKTGCAVGTIKRAAKRCQNGDIIDPASEIPGRIWIGVHIVKINGGAGAASGQAADGFQQAGIHRSWYDVIGAGGALGMFPAQGGIDAAQQDRYRRVGLAKDGNGGLHARVPVGHHGRDQDQIGGGLPGQVVVQPGRADAVAGIAARDVFQARRRGLAVF